MVLLGMWPNLEPERLFAQWAPWAPPHELALGFAWHGGGSLLRGWRAEQLTHGSARAIRSGCQTWLLARFHRSQSKTKGIVKMPPLLLTTTWKTLCENMFCVPLLSLNPSLGTEAPHGPFSNT